MIQIDKKVAIDKILDYFHMEKDEAIAFVSGDNDIELFYSNVGYTVAMGNASNRLKGRKHTSRHAFFFPIWKILLA